MFLKRKSLSLFAFFLFPFAFVPAFAQQTSTQAVSSTVQTPQRDPQAVSAIKNAIAAMGKVPLDSTASGAVTLVEGSTTSSGSIRILTRGTDQSAESIQLTGQTRLSIYSKGSACEGFSGNAAAVSMESSASSQNPDFPLPLLAAAWNDPDFSFQYVGQETLNGSAAYHIRLFDSYASNPGLQPLSEFTAKDLWVSAVTWLPQRIAYQRRDGGGDVPRIAVEISYSDWRNINGVMYPHQIQKSWNGTPWATITIQSVAFQTGLTDNDFPVPLQTATQAGVGL